MEAPEPKWVSSYYIYNMKLTHLGLEVLKYFYKEINPKFTKDLNLDSVEWFQKLFKKFSLYFLELKLEVKPLDIFK